MRHAIVVTLIIASGAGCSSDKGAAPKGMGGQGGAATAGAGAGGVAAASSGGSSTGGSTMSGPPITTAPAAWAAPADCSGVGDTCPNGIFDCTGNSVCQTEGYVCVPPGSDSGLKLQPPSAERPYCLAYQCMTYEEASCFCTGKAGKQYPTCSSPAAVAGLCKGQGASCGSSACCDGLTCVKQSSTVSTCEKTCSQGSDCDTGCCTDPHDSGQKICAPAAACQNPCIKRGEACSAGMNNCCSGTCVEAMNTDFAGCRPTCNTNTDCDTGCCQPFSSAMGGFCVDAKYCTCGVKGAPCSGMNAQCCDGNTCAQFDTGPFSCYKRCTTQSDCPVGCCSIFPGENYGACDETGNCPP